MLTTIWLVLGALSFAAVMEHAGFLDATGPARRDSARSTGTLIASVVFTSSASTSSRATSTWRS